MGVLFMKKKNTNKPKFSAASQSENPLISVCMIAKNEEKYIDQCLSSVKPIADEIIFVDTGSTDKTVEIARKYTDKIYLHPWNDSFSEARNHYLKYAKGEWIFQIDADEELFKEDIPKVRKAVMDECIDAVVIPIVSTARKGRSKAVHNVERIFRNNGIIHYEGRVHNRIVGTTSAKFAPIRLLHYGYDIMESDTGKKFERTVNLLKKDLEDKPDNPATHHYLSCSYLSRKMDSEAMEHALKAISLADLHNIQDVMFLWTHYNLSLAYYRTGNLKMSREVAMSGLKKYPDHIDSHFMMIVISFDQKFWKDLVYHADRYLRLVEVMNADPAHFGTLVTCSLNEEWNIHVLMGIARAELGQDVNSQNSFEKAINSAPEPFIALRAIGIYFNNKHFFAKALIYLEKARQLNSNDETVNNLLAKISNTTEREQIGPTISCCMIVKNEEAFLGACLESIKDFVDEIIVVDTGSTDGTVDIARVFTEKVYFHPWNNSFSEARNQAMSYATGDWILTIDADEELVAGAGTLLRQAVREAGSADAILANVISIYSGGQKTARHNSERLLRNNGVIHYEGSVHNQVTGVTQRMMSKIELMHYGYNVEEKKANEKFLRTVELLKHQVHEKPDDPRPHHYLGTSYLSRGMLKESAEESTLAIRLAESQRNNDAVYLATHHNAARAFFSLRDLNNARHYSLNALKIFPDHLDSLYMMALLSAEEKQWEDALHYGLRFLELRDDYENNLEKSDIILNATIKDGGTINLIVGHAYYARKNEDSMYMHYQNAYDLSEDNKWQAWWNIGIFHMDRSGDLMLSRKYLDLALGAAPAERAVWYMLAKWNGKTGNDREEKNCLARVFELGSQDVMVLNRLAALSLAAGDLAIATQALDALLNIDSQNYSALCSLGFLHRRQNALDLAMEAFSKAIEVNPQEAEPWFNLGEIALHLGQLDNARHFFEHASKLGKEMLKALLYLCEIELRQDRIVEFVNWCDLLMKELHLNRDRTINSIADLSIIMHEIKVALIHNNALSDQATNVLSLLPGSRH